MQRFIGRVVGTAMQKTAKVSVERLMMHPKYPKVLLVKKNYHVHDPLEQTVVGDIVAIEYKGKMSKLKSFVLTDILKRAREYKDPRTGKVYTSA